MSVTLLYSKVPVTEMGIRHHLVSTCSHMEENM